MSLGGIAIAIGAMIDAAIVMIENAHKHLERARTRRAAHRDIDRGGQRGRPVAVLQPLDHHGFVPAGLHLEAQEGRLFKPLAFTKTFAMAAAAILSVTLVPVLMVLFVRGQDRSRAQEPDQPAADLGLPAADPQRAEGQDVTIVLALAVLAVSAWPAGSSAPSSCRA